MRMDRSAQFYFVWQIVLIAFLITSLIAFFTVPQSVTAQATEPQPDFDWTMPERFGPDGNSDGLIDYFTTSDAISPAAWTVNLDACASTDGDQSITAYRWNSPDIPSMPTTEVTTCATTLDFPQQGDFDVTLTLVTAQDQETSTTKTVTVKDWLIVSLGDSYASGEGVPDKTASLLQPSPTWQDSTYHRSALAGPAVAARQLETSDPKSSVTFVHLARSGARIIHEDPTQTELSISAQITEAIPLVGSREIDGLLLSIGVNDAGFRRILQTCMTIEPCNADEFDVNQDGLSKLICDKVLETFGSVPGAEQLCLQGGTEIEEETRIFTDNWTKNAAKQFDELSALLPSRYDQLASELAMLNVRAGGIYITEYADPTRQDSGDLCPQAGGQNDLPGISTAEYQWVSESVVSQMNGLIQGAAQRNGWHYVGGIVDGFLPHGYCANQNWIVRLTQSVATQADLFGTLHPNQNGHAFIGERVAAHLNLALNGASVSVYMPTAFR